MLTTPEVTGSLQTIRANYGLATGPKELNRPEPFGGRFDYIPAVNHTDEMVKANSSRNRWEPIHKGIFNWEDEGYVTRAKAGLQQGCHELQADGKNVEAYTKVITNLMMIGGRYEKCEDLAAVEHIVQEMQHSGLNWQMVAQGNGTALDKAKLSLALVYATRNGKGMFTGEACGVKFIRKSSAEGRDRFESVMQQGAKYGFTEDEQLYNMLLLHTETEPGSNKTRYSELQEKNLATARAFLKDSRGFPVENPLERIRDVSQLLLKGIVPHEWDGRALRDMNTGVSGRVEHVIPDSVREETVKLFDGLEAQVKSATNKPLGLNDAITKAAGFTLAYDAIHPLMEGNGRSTVLFAEDFISRLTHVNCELMVPRSQSSNLKDAITKGLSVNANKWDILLKVKDGRPLTGNDGAVAIGNIYSNSVKSATVAA